ncbi:hypothetical protein NMG60_11009895 [Bertholletia excelsa]
MELEQTMIMYSRKLDKNGNSLLHLVGTRVDTQTVEKMESPLIVLHEDLVNFESIKNVTNHLIDHRNHDGKTANDLFANTNKDLRKDATDWLKRTAENCSLVAVLVATMAFAAAYTVPGEAHVGDDVADAFRVNDDVGICIDCDLDDTR